MQATVTLPYETDWNMEQEITYVFTGGSEIDPTCPRPEPASLALLGVGLLLGTVGFAQRRTQ